jgi:geranylgeranyl reductase family protein
MPDRQMGRQVATVHGVYDVVVVGAGPSGSAAAYHLSSAGIRTLLLDRQRFPRPKVCGDGLTPRAVRALTRLGISHLVDEYPRIAGIRLVNGRTRPRIHRFGEDSPAEWGVVIPRVVLDDKLRKAAQCAGAEFVEGIPATGLSVDEAGRVTGVHIGASTVFARVTVVADGATGRIGKILRGEGQNSQAHGFAARCYLTGVGDLGPYFEVHAPLVGIGKHIPGFAWIFPVAEGIANVGLGIRPDGRYDDPSLVEILTDFLEALRRGDPRFARATTLGPIEGGLLAPQMVDPFTTAPGAILVGDAAHLVNPHTGEGIAYALESGELAARSIVEQLRHRRPAYFHGRRLIASYRRLWILRHPERHLRWLLSMTAASDGGDEHNPIAAALGRVILDDAPRPPQWHHALPPGDNVGTAIRRLGAIVRSKMVARLQTVDALLAVVGDELLYVSDDVATASTIVAAAIAGDAGLANPTLIESLVGIALFALSQLAIDSVPSISPHGSTPGVADAAVVIGDCFATEATAVLTSLPGEAYRLVAAAFLKTARARGDAPRTPATYQALAAPAMTAASLALQEAYPQVTIRSVLEHAQHYAALRQALYDFDRAASCEGADCLRALLRAAPRGTVLEFPALQLVGAALGRDAQQRLNAFVGTDRAVGAR